MGPHRETKSTFSSADSGPTTRIKVASRKPVRPERKPQRRSSPSKRPAGGETASARQPPARPSESRRSTEDARKGGSKTGKRKSTGENGELSEVNIRKLRSAVYDALLGNNLDEKSQLFQKCGSKLFIICKMYALEGPDE